MKLRASWRSLGTRPTVMTVVAVLLALLFLAAGVSLALLNERIGRVSRIHQADVQAQILAASLAAPIAFDDRAAAAEYVNALRLNEDVRAVAAYELDGRLAAGFTRDRTPLPRANPVTSPRLVGDFLVVSKPVLQGRTRLGSVYVRTAVQSVSRRVRRYLGIGLLVLMASLLVAALGAAYASVSNAHRKLQEETREREKAQEALRQSQKMEAMGQLTGGVAHDFNNLLMVASSGLDLMERTTDPTRRERLAQGIRQAIDRGATLTQQLLSFARRSPVRPEVIDLAKRLHGIEDLLERSLREDIKVSIRTEPDLWRVELDPSQLEVAILNVALNARDAMPSGGSIAIEASNWPAEVAGGADRVCLKIADTGHGMPPELVSRVFEPFFTTKAVGQGTGLGLSQVYGFTHSSGGEIQIASEVGAGTTLTLLLPRSFKELSDKEAAAPGLPEATPHRCRVLLVEDDNDVAELVGQMMKELEYDSVRAREGSEALEVLKTGRKFDVVFSDMLMPGNIGGLDLAREVALRHPQLPVLLTTGYSAAAAAARAEGIRLLLKPYRIEALATELRNALDAGRREHERDI